MAGTIAADVSFRVIQTGEFLRNPPKPSVQGISSASFARRSVWVRRRAESLANTWLSSAFAVFSLRLSRPANKRWLNPRANASRRARCHGVMLSRCSCFSFLTKGPDFCTGACAPQSIDHRVTQPARFVRRGQQFTERLHALVALHADRFRRRVAQPRVGGGERRPGQPSGGRGGTPASPVTEGAFSPTSSDICVAIG